MKYLYNVCEKTTKESCILGSPSTTFEHIIAQQKFLNQICPIMLKSINYLAFMPLECSLALKFQNLQISQRLIKTKRF